MKRIFCFRRKESACELFSRYMQERSREASWTQATQQINRTFLLHLENFGKGITLDGLNRERLSEFIGYLRLTAGMEDSTVRKEFKILRAFLRWAQGAGYDVPEDAGRFRPVFKMPLKPVVFLTREELLTLYNYHIPGHRPILEQARALPAMCNQRLNMHLKEVCRMCGFDTPVHVTRFRGGRREDVTVPKYTLVTSHCGRRTFICLMLSIGVPPQVVMKFTGHSNYASMKPYIDISEKAKADAIDAMELALGRDYSIKD